MFVHRSRATSRLFEDDDGANEVEDYDYEVVELGTWLVDVPSPFASKKEWRSFLEGLKDLPNEPQIVKRGNRRVLADPDRPESYPSDFPVAQKTWAQGSFGTGVVDLKQEFSL